MRGLAGAAAAVLLLLAVAAPASARHTEDEHLTENTAYGLRRGEAKIGLWRWDLGVFPHLTVSTIPILWLPRVANLGVKTDVLALGALTLGGGISFASLDVAKGGKPPVRLTLVPIEGNASWRMSDAFTLSGQVLYTKAGVASGASSGKASGNELRGAAAVTNLQLTSTLEWRLGEVTAFLVHGRWLAWQQASGSGDLTFRPDPYTEVEAHLAGKSDVVDVEDAWAIVPSFHFSWDRFNLRLGLGYGNYVIPLVNMVLAAKGPIPEIDLHWRF